MEMEQTAEVFKALGDAHRLRALAFLAQPPPACCQQEGSVCACDLVTHLGLAQPTVSHHMRVLTDAGLVTATKQGRWMHYRLSAAGFALAQQALSELLRVPASPPPTSERTTGDFV
ncbi:ArsR/SmtB family transcription factor [Deinococcus sp.]|uniref:ArsR/SmtB family transcription factor n=1 Tax=Deinococcus sp. TaxID=47478 RepID=UPI003B5AF52F